MINISKISTYKESKDIYNEYYKMVGARNPKWLHYSLLRIAGESRHEAYKGAGFKDQGFAYSGGSLNSSNAIKIEKTFPLIKDFIAIGKHMNMLKVIDEQKNAILSPEERMIMLSSIARGNLTVTEKKRVDKYRKGKKLTTYEDMIVEPNLTERMKSIDYLNKMDNSYKQEITIKKDSNAEIKEMSSDELLATIKNLENSLK